MKGFILALLLLPFAALAAPIQPSDLAVDDNGDLDVFVLCALSGSCVDNIPLVSFMTVASNITPDQAEIDAADKIPLNFDPFAANGLPLPGDEIRVTRTDLGFAYEAEGITLTPDEWILLLVADGNQWVADTFMTQTGPDSFTLDFSTGVQLLAVDANTDVSQLPLPGSLMLFGAGLIGFASIARVTSR